MPLRSPAPAVVAPRTICSDTQETASNDPVDLKSAVRYIQSVFASFAAGMHSPASCGHAEPVVH
jgi:hypothetical protein